MFSTSIHTYLSRVTYKELDMYSVVYHPNYFAFADTARNQAFQDFGYPVEEQLADKVGFTVAGIENVVFKRPLFMGEEITVISKLKEVSKRSCKVTHWILVGNHGSVELETLNNSVFSADYTLVFVSIADIDSYPLNATNIKGMKAIEFNARAKACLGI